MKTNWLLMMALLCVTVFGCANEAGPIEPDDSDNGSDESPKRTTCKNVGDECPDGTKCRDLPGDGIACDRELTCDDFSCAGKCSMEDGVPSCDIDEDPNTSELNPCKSDPCPEGYTCQNNSGRAKCEKDEPTSCDDPNFEDCPPTCYCMDTDNGPRCIMKAQPEPQAGSGSDEEPEPEAGTGSDEEPPVSTPSGDGFSGSDSVTITVTAPDVDHVYCNGGTVDKDDKGLADPDAQWYVSWREIFSKTKATGMNGAACSQYSGGTLKCTVPYDASIERPRFQCNLEMGAEGVSGTTLRWTCTRPSQLRSNETFTVSKEHILVRNSDPNAGYNCSVQ